jgi:hypothetical protein
LAPAGDALGDHFGQLLVRPGLAPPMHAGGSFAPRRDGVPPLLGTTNTSADASLYVDEPRGTRLKATRRSSAENCG